jgi:hypothetical protein
MQLLQSTTFSKIVKKLHINQKICLDDAVRIIAVNPLSGVLKVGDLASVRIYKFQMVNQLTLLAYKYDEQNSSIILLALGSHENFYRNLKTQLD